MSKEQKRCADCGVIETINHWGDCKAAASLPTSTGGTGQEEKPYAFVKEQDTDALYMAPQGKCAFKCDGGRMFALIQKLYAERDAFRYVAIQNYNAPPGLSDETICALVDSEAKRLLIEKKVAPRG